MQRDERGTVTAFVAVFTVTLLLVAGLVIDGGYVLAARRNAINEAEAAARVGAQAVADPSLRDTSTPVVINVADAKRRVATYLNTTGHSGNVTVAGDTVSVDVSFSRSMTLLGITGVGPVTVRGHGEAAGVRGIAEGDL